MNSPQLLNRMTGWIVAALLGIACVVLTVRVLADRAHRKQQGLFGAWPIRRIRLHELDPVFTAGAFGPTVATEVAFIGRGPMLVPGGTSDAEAWILAVLAKRATRLFEFGTCTGKTAYLWGRNAPENSAIATITLAPSQQHEYVKGPNDTDEDTKFALNESAFDAFSSCTVTASSSTKRPFLTGPIWCLWTDPTPSRTWKVTPPRRCGS